MVNYNISISSTNEKMNSTALSDIIEVPKPDKPNRWHRELILRMVQKDEVIENIKQKMEKMIEKKNALEGKLKAKNEEIFKLNDKIYLLTQELAAFKNDYLKALEEIKILKSKVHDSARKDDIMKQKKGLYDKMQRQLMKSEKLLVQEKLKRHILEDHKVNLHQWRTIKYTDPHYYDILNKKNYLQLELQKKLNVIHSKDAELEKKSLLLNELRNMLKRRPFCYEDHPEEQMLEYYKTIQKQNEKIKVLAAQVNMYETLLSGHYNKRK